MLLDEFCRTAFRKKLDHSITELQRDLDAGLQSTMRRDHIWGAGAAEKRQ